MKIITWIMLNGATLLGCLQAIIKALKELATGVINLISLIIPNSTVKTMVEKVRAMFEKVDGWIEIIKAKLIQPLNQ